MRSAICSVFLAFPIAFADAAVTPQPPTLRLPAGVRPTRYALDLVIVPAQASFSGTVTIDLALEGPTSVLWLNATDLTIDSAELRAAGETLPARVLPGGADFVGFELPRPAGPGGARLAVRYHATMDSERSRGLYRQNEGPGEDDWYAYTFFEPVDARRAFPCFDEPSFKVPWQITMHVKRSHVALGNAPVASETPEAGDMKAVALAESKPLPSYLVAFVVGPFELVEGDTGGRVRTPIRFVVPRGRAAETRYARSVTPRIVALLEDYFDMPYPFVKLDVAVVPRYWGTMEHPGLVALGQPLTLIKPTEEGLRRKQSYANIAIHELAHYWFGDYVTCRWWDDVWLNEALAFWLDAKVTDQLEPSWKYELGHAGARMANAMETDAQETAQRIRLPVEDRDAIQNSFDNSITYAKGAAVLGMIEHWAGEGKFRGAMRRYMNAHAWGNANEGDFLAALRAELGAPAADVMASFVDQPGVPIVSAEVRCEGTPRVLLAQKRFFAAGDRDAPNVWRIPVCLKFGGDAGVGRTCAVLGGPTAEVPLPSCPRWLVPNEEGAGYYRSRYDGTSLAALADVFATQLTVRERVQLAADVEALAAQGSLPLTEALRLLPTFLADSDLRVFRGGIGLLFLLKPSELPEALRPRFGRAVTKLLGVRARTVGWSPRDDEDPEMATVRPMLLWLMAGEARDPDVIAEARRLAERWLVDRTAVAPDMAGSVLAIAARGDEPAYFEKLLAEARRTRDRRERSMLLGTLGGFADRGLNQRALGLLVGGDFDLRDALSIAYRSLFDRDTREPTWVFLQGHWDALTARMREDETMWLFGAVPTAFCDATHARDLEAFLGPRARSHPGAPHALAQALETLRTCEATRERNSAAVAEFLGRF